MQRCFGLSSVESKRTSIILRIPIIVFIIMIAILIMPIFYIYLGY